MECNTNIVLPFRYKEVQCVPSLTFPAFVQAKEAGEVEALIERARNTPKGQKKVYSNIDEMPKGYHPRFVEGAT